MLAQDSVELVDARLRHPLLALRVASAVAELSGVRGPGDITDRLRRGLGLDVLSVQEVSGGGVGGEAGRYVRDGV